MKKKTSPSHTREVANQDNRLRGTDEGGGLVTITTSLSILKDGIFVFLFTCHSSQYGHSLCLLLAGAKL